jgi:hypothetical protein
MGSTVAAFCRFNRPVTGSGHSGSTDVSRRNRFVAGIQRQRLAQPSGVVEEHCRVPGRLADYALDSRFSTS